MDRKYLSLSVSWIIITLICKSVSSSGLMLTHYYNTAYAPEVADTQRITQKMSICRVSRSHGHEIFRRHSPTVVKNSFNPKGEGNPLLLYLEYPVVSTWDEKGQEFNLTR